MRFNDNHTWWTVVNEHQLIRELVDYDLIEKIDPNDIPQVLDFLQVIWNYEKMCEILKEESLT